MASGKTAPASSSAASARASVSVSTAPAWKWCNCLEFQDFHTESCLFLLSQINPDAAQRCSVASASTPVRLEEVLDTSGSGHQWECLSDSELPEQASELQEETSEC